MLKKSRQLALFLLLLAIVFLQSLDLNQAKGSSISPFNDKDGRAGNQAKISRGEATDLVVKHIKLGEKNRDFLNKCQANLGECLFTFSSRTNFNIKLNPLLLYPDVGPAYKFYNSINIASKLDLVWGYSSEEDSPYRPLQPISKIEAIKLLLGASEKINWQEKFELKEAKEVKSAQSREPNEWWYDRYINEAIKQNLIISSEDFNPNQKLSKKEFLQLLESINQ